MKDPYVYEDTNILINLANIKDQKELDNYETTLSRIAIVDILNKPIEINNVNDIFLIHERLFKEVYSWAGKPRTINIYKEESVLSGLSVIYSDYKTINNDLNKIQKSIESINLIKLSKKELIH